MRKGRKINGQARLDSRWIWIERKKADMDMDIHTTGWTGRCSREEGCKGEDE